MPTREPITTILHRGPHGPLFLVSLIDVSLYMNIPIIIRWLRDGACVLPGTGPRASITT